MSRLKRGVKSAAFDRHWSAIAALGPGTAFSRAVAIGPCWGAEGAGQSRPERFTAR